MKYRKKPVVIEAMQFTEQSKDQVLNFAQCDSPTRNCSATRADDGTPSMAIATLEGIMTVSLGDYVIKGVQGEFYPCKPDIFAATYEAEEE